MNKLSSFNNTKYKNVNINHPLIENSQQYGIYRKFISIHSEDRDISKYPKSSFFEMELPEDLLNVHKVSLNSWNFPCNYSAFSINNNNIIFIFQLNNPYNPILNGLNEPLQIAIYEALLSNINNNFVIKIEEGFYNPTQMATELTNKFNEAVTAFLLKYFSENGVQQSIIDRFIFEFGYNEFIIVYNNVGHKIWFGNRSSGFQFKNTEVALITSGEAVLDFCLNKNKLPDYSNWGLPNNLGFGKCDFQSIETKNISDVRFYYGDVFSGDNGFWLLPNPNLPNSSINYIVPTYKINLMGNSDFYLSIDELNCIDETSPYNLSKFTQQTNQTNSIVNASFAVIPVPTTPLSQFYGLSQGEFQPYKMFYPPAERIRKLTFRIRYHNGSLVDFGLFNFSFILEFRLLSAQINRSIANLNADYSYSG